MVCNDHWRIKFCRLIPTIILFYDPKSRCLIIQNNYIFTFYFEYIEKSFGDLIFEYRVLKPLTYIAPFRVVADDFVCTWLPRILLMHINKSIPDFVASSSNSSNTGNLYSWSIRPNPCSMYSLPNSDMAVVLHDLVDTDSLVLAQRLCRTQITSFKRFGYCLLDS